MNDQDRFRAEAEAIIPVILKRVDRRLAVTRGLAVVLAVAVSGIAAWRIGASSSQAAVKANCEQSARTRPIANDARFVQREDLRTEADSAQQVHLPDQAAYFLKLRSMVVYLPLIKCSDRGEQVEQPNSTQEWTGREGD